MDYRPYILAGTFLLFVVALVTFVTTLARSRTRHQRHFAHNGASTASEPSRPMDTSLEGLELVVSEDAPSASLLKPLKESEWMPEETATTAALADVSLAERVANYIPAPAVPEPAFSIESYPFWKVPEPQPAPPSAEPPAAEPAAPPAAELPAAAPAALAAAEPPAAESTEPPAASWAMTVPEVRPEAEMEDEFSDEAFGAQIAALLPSSEEPPLPLSHEVERVEIVEPAPQRAEDERPAAVARPAAEDRPVVTVVAAEPPTPSVEPVASPAPRPSRPQVRVFAEGGQQAVVDAIDAEAVRPLDPVRAAAPDIIMDAPVEIWFGESRVGVKAGSETYERFRKYADILLADLKDAQGGTR